MICDVGNMIYDHICLCEERKSSPLVKQSPVQASMPGIEDELEHGGLMSQLWYEIVGRIYLCTN